MGGGYQPSAQQEAARAEQRKAELAVLRERLNARVDELVPQLLPGARRAGNFWEVKSIEGDQGSSMKINRTGMRGYWTQFNAQAGQAARSGSMLDIVVHRKYHGDFGAAMQDLRASEGLVNVSPAEAARFAAQAAAVRDHAARESSAAEARNRSRAQALWHGAVPIAGTPGEAYLQGRVPGWQALGRWPGSLRYRPDVGCPVRSRYPDWQGFPALVAAVFGPDGRVAACHRTYLDISQWDHASKRGAVRVHKLVRLHDREEADEQGALRVVRDPPGLLDPDHPPDPDTVRSTKSHKATLGRYADVGGYIPLRKGSSGKVLREVPPGTVVHFAEGIEDALNYAVSGAGGANLGAWIGAAVSLANMANVWLPPQAGGLCIVADRAPPDNMSEIDSFEAAVAAHQARRDNPEFVRAVWPAPGFKDFSDEAMGLWAMGKHGS